MTIDLDAPLTKRRLGWLLLAGAGLAVAAVLAADWLGAGLDRGFGPAQRAGLAGAALAALFGASLLPWGGRQSPPASRASPVVARPTAPEQARGRPFWVARALFWAALVIYLAYALIYLNYAVALFRFPFDYDQGEGFELNDTILFARGEWPYRDNEVYPFYASNYPPLFHLMAVPFVWMFGPQYWIGRALSFAATLVTAAAIGWAVWREGGRREIAALAGLAFLASNYVYHVGPLFRQHMTMVMFETLAVIAAAKLQPAGAGRRANWPLAALVWLLLAGYTKQLAWSTAIAVLAFFFSARPAPRHAVGPGLRAGGRGHLSDN